MARSRSFTLVELIITLAIVGIIVSLIAVQVKSNNAPKVVAPAPNPVTAVEQGQARYRVDKLDIGFGVNIENRLQTFINKHPNYEIVSVFQRSESTIAPLYIVSKVR